MGCKVSKAYIKTSMSSYKSDKENNYTGVITNDSYSDLGTIGSKNDFMRVCTSFISSDISEKLFNIDLSQIHNGIPLVLSIILILLSDKKEKRFKKNWENILKKWESSITFNYNRVYFRIMIDIYVDFNFYKDFHKTLLYVNSLDFNIVFNNNTHGGIILEDSMLLLGSRFTGVKGCLMDVISKTLIKRRNKNTSISVRSCMDIIIKNAQYIVDDLDFRYPYVK